MHTRTFIIGLVSLFFALSLTPSAFATPGWSVVSHIETIEQNSGVNGVWITVDAAVKNDNCAGTPGAYFLADDNYSTPNYKYKSDFAMLMASYITGRSVDFYISGCSAYGNPLVAAIRIRE